MKKVAIIGSGAWSQYVAYYIEGLTEYSFVGFIDKIIDIDKNIIGTDNELDNLYKKHVFDCVYIGIGYAHPDLKEIIYKKCKNYNIPLASFIHPTALIHPTVRMGEGNFVGPYSIIDNNTRIGNCCIIRSNVLVGHDDVLDNFSYIGSHAVVAGNVIIKEKCFLGVNCTIRNKMIISEYTTIGCGANVVKSIEKGHQTYAGNPAKVLPNKCSCDSKI